MKAISIKIVILLVHTILVFSWMSCMDQLPQESIEEFTVQVIIPLDIQEIMPQDIEDSVHYAHQKLTLKSNRLTYTATTDSLGKAVFKQVIPGIYDISTNQKLTDEISLTGDTMQFGLFEKDSLVLSIHKSIKENLIISKVYASGTKDNNNKNYTADGYIEIFNNSDQTQYLDSSMYLGLVEAESVIAFPASDSAGYVFARQVFKFTVEGVGFAVAPGGSVVIANSAIDHTQFSPFSVNLQNADFEAKNTTFSNNSNVKEMELIYSAFPSLIYMNLVRGGDNGAFLFKTTSNVRDFPNYYVPGKEMGSRYMRIPIGLVLDGVESLKNWVTTGPKPKTKRLQNFVDAGYMFITSSGGYTHESIERRVDRSKPTTVRYYLMDTNNSSNDFKSLTDPTPRKYDKPLLLVD